MPSDSRNLAVAAPAVQAIASAPKQGSQLPRWTAACTADIVEFLPCAGDVGYADTHCSVDGLAERSPVQRRGRSIGDAKPIGDVQHRHDGTHASPRESAGGGPEHGRRGAGAWTLTRQAGGPLTTSRQPSLSGLMDETLPSIHLRRNSGVRRETARSQLTSSTRKGTVPRLDTYITSIDREYSEMRPTIG